MTKNFPTYLISKSNKQRSVDGEEVKEKEQQQKQMISVLVHSR